MYDELRQIARRYMGKERRGHTLQATALVNEVYLRLFDTESRRRAEPCPLLCDGGPDDATYPGGFGASPRQYQKRGGGAQRVSLDEGLVVSPELSPDLIAFDEALQRSRVTHKRKGEVVEMRFFGG